MRLSPAKFNALLAPSGQGMSQVVMWRKSFRCPCVNAVSGQAKQNCPSCGARGVIWNAAIRAWTGLSSMSIARAWAAFGQWEAGDVVVTIPSDSPFYAAAEFDRVLMTDSTEPFSVILTRSGTERVVGLVTVIDSIVWLDPITQTVVQGALPLLNADGSYAWEDPTTAPPTAIQYTVTGRRNPEYFVYKNLPQDRAHFGGLPLPRRVALRRFDLFGRAGKPS
jgi:hypothetical protein